MNELAVRNAKYAGECVELHLAKRNISVLADRFSHEKNQFERFVNLEASAKCGGRPCRGTMVPRGAWPPEIAHHTPSFDDDVPPAIRSCG